MADLQDVALPPDEAIGKAVREMITTKTLAADRKKVEIEQARSEVYISDADRVKKITMLETERTRLQDEIIWLGQAIELARREFATA